MSLTNWLTFIGLEALALLVVPLLLCAVSRLCRVGQLYGTGDLKRRLGKQRTRVIP